MSPFCLAAFLHLQIDRFLQSCQCTIRLTRLDAIVDWQVHAFAETKDPANLSLQLPGMIPVCKPVFQ